MATQPTEIKSTISNSNLEEFKKLIRKAVFLESNEEQYFNSIPNEKWYAIFETNFGGNWTYAQRVLLNKFRDIDNIDTARVDREKLKIANLDVATQFITNAIDNKTPTLFITDFDNDGSLSQSIINEYLKIDQEAAKNMQVHYAQSINGNSNRGFTVDLVDRIVEHRNLNPNEKFLIITADNGINSVEEQIKVQAKYPLAQIIITDHHNPDPEMVIQENENVVIFNPHYKPTEFYKTFNISGATTVGVLLKNVLTTRFSKEQLLDFKSNLDNIQKLSKVANLLDYVNTDAADKPEKNYVISKFLKLQPLLNINNSISKIITGEISPTTIQAIKDKIPNLNSDILYEEAKNIHIQNFIAKILLKIHKNNLKTDIENKKLKEDPENPQNEHDLKILKQGFKNNFDYFQSVFLKEITDTANYFEEDVINPNYIEQLRPLIFGLSADDTKNTFMDTLNDYMINVFENIKVSEKAMAEELRNGEVITKSKLENSVIAYTDKHILTVFNRKFLNKVYNDENPGFSLTLDSIDKEKVSGSFRSLYNISDILKDKAKIEKSLNIKIETPGHEKAAGFIIKALNHEKQPIDKNTIEAINVFINDSIAKIKSLEQSAKPTYLLTDLTAIKLIDRINEAVRGNVSNFERITPLLKITPDTVWTDSYSTKQFTMKDIIKDRKYGYATININFHGDTVIIPIELIRKIVDNKFKDYLSLNYMDGGVFMAEKIVSSNEAVLNKNIIDLRGKNNKAKLISEVFEKDFKDKNHVDLNREQIKDNPFFKYHDYGNLNFDLFERMVIGIIDSNNVDILSVFDVEANGFANSKLMNLGSMNYSIKKDSGETVEVEDFSKRLYATQRSDEFLLTEEQIGELVELSYEEVEHLSVSIKRLLFVKSYDNDFNSTDNSASGSYYYHPSMTLTAENPKKNPSPFLAVKNYLIDNTTETVSYNREIEATMLAYLVKDKDFKVPQEMTNLTGISQEILDKYGKPTNVVDADIVKYYEGKDVLFGAHNTPYDARVLRANTPKFYETLKKNKIYDSALFSKDKKLAYDEITVSSIQNIDGISKSIYFYNNEFSDYNFSKFIIENKNGYYPDRTGKYLFSIEDGKYFLVDKEKHESILVEADQETLLKNLFSGEIPNVSVKYSVEKLSEQWMIHSLLLSDEKFDISHVSVNNEEFASLNQFEDTLIFFQDNYHFESTPAKNINNFYSFYINNGGIKFNEQQRELFETTFINKFLEQNKDIQQKFSDAWVYKSVLTIKEPDTNDDITNDLVDLVQFQTAIPREKVITIFKEALAFKKKYNISHIIQHEGHINGPWETDEKGDVAFEDKLTLSLIAQRNYDPYYHSVRNAVREFNQFSLRARDSFDKADKFSTEAAQDSYSFRQAILYNRAEKTDVIIDAQTKEKNLKRKSDDQIIIFKLDNDVLPPETSVYGVKKKGVSMNREQLEKDSKMLSFILTNEQIRNSLSSVNGDDTECVETILDSNDKVSLKYKKDLSKRYRYFEYNKKIYQVKKVLDSLHKIVNEGFYKETKTTRELSVDHLGHDGFNLIKDLFEKYVNTANSNEDTMLRPDGVMAAKEFLYLLRTKNDYPTKLETILETGAEQGIAIHFETEKEVKDKNFFASVDILRQKPIKNLLTGHTDLRLLNNFIESNQAILKEEIIVKKSKKNKP